ncbi:MAG: IS200/IS605 family transposase [Sulfurovum sp.]
MEVRYSSHGVYKTQYHIVFVTKFRRKVLNPGFGKYTQEAIKGAVEFFEDVELLEINAQVDHVHMVIVIPSKHSIATVIRKIKSESAKIVRDKFEWLDKVYWGTRSLWSTGYFVSTIGLDEKQILNYVKYQKKKDSGQAKLEV